jgi:hypothetical protein
MWNACFNIGISLHDGQISTAGVTVLMWEYLEYFLKVINQIRNKIIIATQVNRDEKYMYTHYHQWKHTQSHTNLNDVCYMFLFVLLQLISTTRKAHPHEK